MERIERGLAEVLQRLDVATLLQKIHEEQPAIVQHWGQHGICGAEQQRLQ